MAENLNKPGVYRGQQKLATQQDLALFRQEIRQLIAGPISEISENGYIPWKYNIDGSLDIEYLFPEMVQSFKENTGISISRNGISYANNIKSINFAGNYVFLSLDENGELVVDIRPPKQETSRFNDVDGITDSILRIRNKVLSGAIIPETTTFSNSSIYGNWEAGSVQEYINWNGSLREDFLVLSTNENVFASDLNSCFEIGIFDGYGMSLGTFLTKPIAGNKDNVEPQGSGHSFYISVNITNFKEENSGLPSTSLSGDSSLSGGAALSGDSSLSGNTSKSNGYSFKPEFKFNLINLIGQSGGRFYIKIVHHDGVFHNSYISKNYLYNVGTLPSFDSQPVVSVITDPMLSGSSIFTYCSGIKYILNGSINLLIKDIKDLNNLAAVEDKVEYEFNAANQNIVNENGEFEKYDLKVGNMCDWKTTLMLNNDIFLNSPTTGYVKFKNAFGESEKYPINISILLNSQNNLTAPDNLNEYFSNEARRVKNSFEIYGNSTNISNLNPWDSTSSLIDYDNGTGLMVTPGVGLSFPSGDWRSFKPAGSPNYNNIQFLAREKFFSRVFIGNSKLKFGGKFIFKGISKEDVLDLRFDCMISPDQGSTWYSIKHIRGTKVVFQSDIDPNNSFTMIGVMTNIQDIKDDNNNIIGVEVSWAYPSTMASDSPIYFKLGMKPTAPFVIKSISLINLDNTKEW